MLSSSEGLWQCHIMGIVITFVKCENLTCGDSAATKYHTPLKSYRNQGEHCWPWAIYQHFLKTLTLLNLLPEGRHRGKPLGIDAHEQERVLLVMGTALALGEDTASIEPAGKAEKAIAAKSEALVPWAQHNTKHKVKRLPREGNYMHKMLLTKGKYRPKGSSKAPWTSPNASLIGWYERHEEARSCSRSHHEVEMP
jgi:hypothetical protein